MYAAFKLITVGLRGWLGFPDSSVGKESACNSGDRGSITWVGKIRWRRNRLPTPYSWASLVAQLVKNPPAMQETWVGNIPWRRERLLNISQCSDLENSMDFIVHEVAKSGTGLSDFDF